MALQGGGGNASAIKAGEAFVSFGVRDNAFTRGIAGVEKRLAAFGGGAVKAGLGVFGAGASALGALGAAAASQLPELAKLQDMATAFGLTAEAASGLFGVMRAAGSDVRDAQEGLITFNQRVADALAGTGEEAKELFRGLGVSAQEFAGPDTAERFYKLHAALLAVEDPTKRVGLLLKAVGEDTGKNLTSTLSMTTDQLREQAGTYRMTGEELKAAKDATGAYNTAVAKLDMVFKQVAVAVAPLVEQLATAFAQVATPVAEFVRNNKDLVAGAALVAAGLAAAGAAVVGIGLAASVAATAIGGLATLVSVGLAAVEFAVAAVLSPVGLFVAGLTAAGAAAVLLSDDATQFAADLAGAVGIAFDDAAGAATEAFHEISGTAKQTWGGIVDALQAGDLALAGEIAMTGLKLAWEQGLAGITQVWEEWKARFWTGLEVIRDWWSGMVDFLAVSFFKGLNEIERRFNAFTGRSTADQEQRANDINAEAEQARRDREKKNADNLLGIRQAAENAKRLAAEESARTTAALKARLTQMTADAAFWNATGAATGPGTKGYKPGGIPDVSSFRASVVGTLDARQVFGGGGSPVDKLAKAQADAVKATEDVQTAVQEARDVLVLILAKTGLAAWGP